MFIKSPDDFEGLNGSVTDENFVTDHSIETDPLLSHKLSYQHQLVITLARIRRRITA